MKKTEDLLFKMFNSLKKIFQAGWKSFSRDKGIVIGTIFIIVVTISLVTSLFILKDLSEFFISSLKEKVDISVYFYEEALEEDIFSVKEDLFKIPEVQGVEYVSRGEALEKFIERYKDDQAKMEALREVGFNPFLASLNIKAAEASQYGAIASFLEDNYSGSLIEKIDYHQRKSVIERIFSISSFIEKAGFALSLFFAFLAILVSFNTIRLAIYNSREEIKVMRLVGASSWFIRGPFLAEGAICGAFAVLVSLLLFSPLSYFLSPGVESLLPGFNLFSYFLSHFWVILFLQIFVGLGLGVTSSFIAIKKYLEV
ncbi:ABC transporter permease [Patescibacteria group bacterium]|nr:ABC transporter permease [Patescibacteria group bacterium]